MSVLKENQTPQFLFMQAANKLKLNLPNMNPSERREREIMFYAGIAQTLGFMREEVGAEPNEDKAVEMMQEMEDLVIGKLKSFSK